MSEYLDSRREMVLPVPAPPVLLLPLAAPDALPGTTSGVLSLSSVVLSRCKLERGGRVISQCLRRRRVPGPPEVVPRLVSRSADSRDDVDDAEAPVEDDEGVTVVVVVVLAAMAG
uniref:Uncharacterized protein n=1 Tax=Anopheles merus TaxID=30066 RepID=A0A182V6A4_ANOME